MASKGLEAKTVGLKVKTTKFEVRTQDHTRKAYVSTADELYATASSLLLREIRNASSSAPGRSLQLRLMGVRASSFRGQAGAPQLKGQGTLDGFFAPQTNSGLITAASPRKPCGNPMANEAERRQEGELTGPGAAVQGAAREGEVDKRDPSDGEYQEFCSAFVEVERRPETERGIVDGGTPLQTGAASGVALPLGVISTPPRLVPSRKRCLWEPSAGLSGETRRRGDAPEAIASSDASVSCPVCGRLLGAVTNAALNRHVDGCLGISLSLTEDANGNGDDVMKQCSTPEPSTAKGDWSSQGISGPLGRHAPASRKRAKVPMKGIKRFLTSME